MKATPISRRLESCSVMRRTGMSPAGVAWIAFGGLLVLGLTVLVAQELPSMRRELRLMRM